MEEGEEVENKKVVRVRGARAGAMNTTKHPWAGAVAVMVSRAFVAPLQRLKLEYIACGEQMNLFGLIKKIAGTQGLKGFWKGNFVNLLRTAPFKIRTKMGAPGGEALGGVIGVFHHMLQTEGFFSLYKGSLPSLLAWHPQAQFSMEFMIY